MNPVTDMRATVLQQIETDPATWPFPSFMSDPRYDDLEVSTIWRRIEAYTAWRSTTRGVLWIVEGPGSWSPPLFPATITSTQIWTPAVNGWAAIADIPAGPLGQVWLSGAGPFRLVGEAGDSDADIPSDIMEAYRRLAEYFVGERSSHAGSSHELAAVGPIREEFHRDPAWLGKAMQNSGAADLLRRYRKAP